MAWPATRPAHTAGHWWGCETRRSPIPWTDYSAGDLNFVTGCTPISEGCAACYAKAIYERHGWDFSHVRFHPEKLERLWRWNLPGVRGRPDGENLVREKAFVCDTGDLFHESLPYSVMIEALWVMGNRDDIIWQVLTKRPEQARRVSVGIEGWPANVWLGVTAENQRRAAERIPILLQIPAAVRFVSVEPMLEPVVLRLDDDFSDHGHGRGWRGLSWIIAGAESGPRRRPFQRTWAEALYWQCRDAGIPYFGKQDSGPRPGVDLLLRQAPESRSATVIHQFPEVQP